MNFKKYHVSKNLFDYSTTEIGSISTTDGSDVEYDYARRSDFIPVQAGVTYTFSGLGGNIRIFEYKPDKTYRNTNYLYTIPVEISRTGYIRIAGALTAVIPEIMLNEGDTALPYEPYSSEVWHDIPHYIHKTSTDTITTLPAVLYPNAVTATVGLKGNMSQSGTPTPTTPIQPQSCGERTGNLFDEVYPNLVVETSVKYKALYVGEGQFTLSTNCPLVQTGTADLFFISGNVSSGASTNINGVWNEQPRTVTSSNGYVTVGYRKYSDTHPLLTDYNVMLNTGSTPLPYEPFGVKIPILSNSTTTNIYLGEVQSTRQIKKLVLTGEEDWEWQSGQTLPYFRLSNTVTDGITGQVVCTHYVSPDSVISSNNTTRGTRVQDSTNYGRILIIRTPTNETDTISSFKSYLQQQYAAGTPVCVWYILATPTTGIVNEPLMKIGDYADEVSGITIPTIAGENTIDVDTTLQPSEVSVNYHGWHPVVDVHERENGAWT